MDKNVYTVKSRRWISNLEGADLDIVIKKMSEPIIGNYYLRFIGLFSSYFGERFLIENRY